MTEERYLAELRLKIHPIKSQRFKAKRGANFLGFRVLPHCIRVRSENLRRARRRLRQMEADYLRGEVTGEEISRSIQSWFAHLEHGDTWRLRQKILASLTPDLKSTLEQALK